MRLDRRVQFLRAALVDNGLEQVETFANHGAPVWANRKDVSDGEKARAGETQATLVSRFQIRSSVFARGISPKDRLITEGATYDITGIKELGRRDYLEITATARADK